MDLQELEILNEKVKSGRATSEEQLTLLKEMNKGAKDLADLVKELKADKTN